MEIVYFIEILDCFLKRKLVFWCRTLTWIKLLLSTSRKPIYKA